MEVSKVGELEVTNLGKILLVSSGKLVVAGKYFYCFLSKKEDSVAIKMIILAME